MPKHRLVSFQKCLLLIMYISIMLSGSAHAFPVEAARPGGLVRVDLGHSPQKPRAFYNKTPVLVTQMKGHWVALVGIDIHASVGEHQLEVEDEATVSPIAFEIRPHDYPTERFKIKEKKFDEPSTNVVEQIKEDAARLHQAFIKFSQRSEDLGFVVPVQGKWIDNYGHRRIINDIAKSPHKGVDIVAPRGTPVVAVSSGTVVLTHDLFFTGKTVVVDHGQGLQTLYCHLDTMTVEVGQVLTKGQKLGTVGKTGRATGPHLHFGVSLNNARIDPTLWFSQKT